MGSIRWRIRRTLGVSLGSKGEIFSRQFGAHSMWLDRLPSDKKRWAWCPKMDHIIKQEQKLSKCSLGIDWQDFGDVRYNLKTRNMPTPIRTTMNNISFSASSMILLCTIGLSLEIRRLLLLVRVHLRAREYNDVNIYIYIYLYHLSVGAILAVLVQTFWQTSSKTQRPPKSPPFQLLGWHKKTVRRGRGQHSSRCLSWA